MGEKRRPAPPFEFDERKSRINKLKHGIDSMHHHESRSLVIGRIGGRHGTAVITRRGDRVRLISVRRSRVKEIARYEG